MTREEIRTFFIRRSWFLHPPDLDLIKSCQTSKARHEQLVWFARGYLTAKTDGFRFKWEEEGPTLKQCGIK